MMFRFLTISLLAFGPCFVQAQRQIPPQGPWELQDGDRVVFLGDTFLEREGNFGHLETYLTTAFPDRNITFRNLAWSGDTPQCEARSYFGKPDEGFGRLKGHLELVKPSVVIACYGAANAHDGEAGIPAFIEHYKKLLDMIHSTTQAAVVLVSPPAGEARGPMQAAVQLREKSLAAYSAAIGALAKERNLRFADFLTATAAMPQDPAKPRTNNGIHYTETGYRDLAPVFAKTLGLEKSGLPAESLRAMIREKNTLFFHRWRPQNETYLFGFRKHEQGNNSVEIPQFDPLIEAKEKAIAAERSKIKG